VRHDRAQRPHVGLQPLLGLPAVVQEVERQRTARPGIVGVPGDARSVSSQNPAAWSAGSSVGSATCWCFQIATL
jgi:hypothetical protein